MKERLKQRMNASAKSVKDDKTASSSVSKNQTAEKELKQNSIITTNTDKVLLSETKDKSPDKREKEKERERPKSRTKSFVKPSNAEIFHLHFNSIKQYLDKSSKLNFIGLNKFYRAEILRDCEKSLNRAIVENESIIKNLREVSHIINK